MSEKSCSQEQDSLDAFYVVHPYVSQLYPSVPSVLGPFLPSLLSMRACSAASELVELGHACFTTLPCARVVYLLLSPTCRVPRIHEAISAPIRRVRFLLHTPPHFRKLDIRKDAHRELCAHHRDVYGPDAGGPRVAQSAGVPEGGAVSLRTCVREHCSARQSELTRLLQAKFPGVVVL